jgi:hypothetical protein
MVKNQKPSLAALGRVSGSNTLDYDDENFENINYRAS